MATRLIFLALFTAVTGLFAIALTGMPQFTWGVLSAFGVVSMAYTIRNFKTVEMENDMLTVGQPFKEKRSVYLNQVVGWKEQSFFIRGTRRRSLILFFSEGKRLIISDYDDVKDFERLLEYLKSRFEEPASQHHSPLP